MTKQISAVSKKSEELEIVRRPLITAILVDGGFYRRRSYALFGSKEPRDRADELMSYCRRHIRQSQSNLYRVFYYDCPPSEKVIYHPLLRKHVNLRKSDQYKWANDFFNALIHKRKLAFRRGEELETQHGYFLKPEPLKDLCAGRITVEDLTETDFGFDITQKGVDMRIGLDIASLAQGKVVNQIIMISGDSDLCLPQNMLGALGLISCSTQCGHTLQTVFQSTSMECEPVLVSHQKTKKIHYT